MSEEPKKPRKRKTDDEKLTKLDLDAIDNIPEMSDKETQYLKGLIQAGIEQARVKKLFETSDREKLNKMIQEFLDCYIVIGYNFQGEPVNLLSVESQQQADSLGTALTRFMAGLPRGPMNPFDSPPPDGY